MSLALLKIGAGPEPSIWALVEASDWVTRFVLLLLLGFSLVSWAIILRKALQLRRIRSRVRAFFDAFESRGSLAEAYQASLAIPHNPLSEVFKAGVRELKHLTPRAAHEDALDFEGRPAAPAPRAPAITVLEKESIHMALERESARQVEALESGLTFLATTGSVAPFFGLFGTVWGIMDAFLRIGLSGTGNVSVVAPGVAEALITTIAGLAVAIPAVIAYNWFVSRLKELGDDMRHFSSELINVIVRERRG